MDKPFAITLDVGSSLANHTGTWRTERPVYVDRLPPCNHACPAGENIQDWLYHAEDGELRGGLARSSCDDNPFPAVMGRVCYHPCETACNRGQLDEAVGINSVERFLGDEAIRQGWQLDRAGAADRASACWSSAPGRPGCPPPTTSPPAATRSTIHEAGAAAGRHDALRHPDVPAAARRARRRDRSASSTSASTLELRHARSTDIARRDARRAASTRPSSPSAPTSASAPTSRPARRRTILDAVSLLRGDGGRGAAAARPPRRRLRRRQHRDGRRAHRASGSAPTRRSSSTGAPATGCRRTTSRSRRRWRRASLMQWLSHDHAASTAASSTVEKMELDETGFPQPTGEFEELEADSRGARARPGRRPVAARRRARRRRSSDGVVAGRRAT